MIGTTWAGVVDGDTFGVGVEVTGLGDGVSTEEGVTVGDAVWEGMGDLATGVGLICLYSFSDGVGETERIGDTVGDIGDVSPIFGDRIGDILGVTNVSPIFFFTTDPDPALDEFGEAEGVP